jgi:acylphosphatase
MIALNMVTGQSLADEMIRTCVLSLDFAKAKIHCMPVPASTHSRLHATVHGIVQGVNFRYHTRRVARSLLLTGWVRNRPDGSVEVLAEGPRSQLESLLAFLRTGPSSARVDMVQVDWLPIGNEYDGFEIVG